MTYRQATDELEIILRALETDQIDVDDLTARVERSAELIRLCRHKLRHAEASLDKVFDTLDDEDQADEEREPEDAEDEQDEEAAGEDEEDKEDDEDDHLPGGPGRFF